MENLHFSIYGPNLQQVEYQKKKDAELEQAIKRNPMMKAGIMAEHEAKYPEAVYVNIRQKISEEGCYAARKEYFLEAAGVTEGLSFRQQMQKMCPPKQRKRKRTTFKQNATE